MSGSRFASMPRQTGQYAVKVKNGAGWRKFDVARLQISVGMPYHENEKFETTASWVGQRFKKAIICVNDTLQRFNLMYENPGMTEEEALHKTLRAGREWVLRNMRALESLPDFSLHHWEEWKLQPAFSDNKNKIATLYRDNPDFREAISRNIMDHWQRYSKKRADSSGALPGAADYEVFAHYSTQYLLEETAAFGVMYARESAADIYPGTLLIPVKFLQENEVNGAPKGYGDNHHTRIDFVRLPAPSGSGILTDSSKAVA